MAALWPSEFVVSTTGLAVTSPPALSGLAEYDDFPHVADQDWMYKSFASLAGDDYEEYLLSSRNRAFQAVGNCHLLVGVVGWLDGDDEKVVELTLYWHDGGSSSGKSVIGFSTETPIYDYNQSQQLGGSIAWSFQVRSTDAAVPSYDVNGDSGLIGGLELSGGTFDWGLDTYSLPAGVWARFGVVSVTVEGRGSGSSEGHSVSVYYTDGVVENSEWRLISEYSNVNEGDFTASISGAIITAGEGTYSGDADFTGGQEVQDYYQYFDRPYGVLIGETPPWYPIGDFWRTWRELDADSSPLSVPGYGDNAATWVRGELPPRLPYQGDNIVTTRAGMELLTRCEPSGVKLRPVVYRRPSPLASWSGPVEIGTAAVQPRPLSAAAGEFHQVRQAALASYVSRDLGQSYAEAPSSGNPLVTGLVDASGLVALATDERGGVLLAARLVAGDLSVVLADGSEVALGSSYPADTEVCLWQRPDGLWELLVLVDGTKRLYTSADVLGRAWSEYAEVTLSRANSCQYWVSWVSRAGEVALAAWSTNGDMRVWYRSAVGEDWTGPWCEAAAPDTPPYVYERPDGLWEVGWVTPAGSGRVTATAVDGVWSS